MTEILLCRFLACTKWLFYPRVPVLSDDLKILPARKITLFPGLPSLPVNYLPHQVASVEGEDRRFLLRENLTKQFQHCREASCILINSHKGLEDCSVEVLQKKTTTSLEHVGPLISPPQLSQFRKGIDFEDVWEWLNTKAPLSVLYISLGSVVSWSKSQVEEVGLGLLAKQQVFLWVLRPWEMMQVLPQELLALGKAVKFAPQVQVLGHPAIGGFLSHCGWNSTLESLSMGVPFLTWPHFLDQFTNCWYIVHVWKVGLELAPLEGESGQVGILDRHRIKHALMLLMDTEKGQLIRSRALGLKQLLQKHNHSQSFCRALDVILSDLDEQEN